MKNIVKELLPYVIILVSVILIRTFIITPVIVSGDSMKPNLHNGELLLERKIGYSGSSIKRFDIVVIREEKEDSPRYKACRQRHEIVPNTILMPQIIGNFRSFLFAGNVRCKTSLFFILLIVYIFFLLNHQNAQGNFHNGKFL